MRYWFRYKQVLPLLNHLVPAFGRHSVFCTDVFPCGSVGLGRQLLLLRLEAIPRPFHFRNPLLRVERRLVVSTAELGQNTTLFPLQFLNVLRQRGDLLHQRDNRDNLEWTAVVTLSDQRLALLLLCLNQSLHRMVFLEQRLLLLDQSVNQPNLAVVVHELILQHNYLIAERLQDRVVQMGLVTRERLNRNRKVFKLATLTVMLAFVLWAVYGVNSARGFWQPFRQILILAMVEGLFDRFFIDWYWVGHTKAWTIPGTEDLKPYIPRKTLIVKWALVIFGSPIIAAVIAGLMMLVLKS